MFFQSGASMETQGSVSSADERVSKWTAPFLSLCRNTLRLQCMKCRWIHCLMWVRGLKSVMCNCIENANHNHSTRTHSCITQATAVFSFRSGKQRPTVLSHNLAWCIIILEKFSCIVMLCSSYPKASHQWINSSNWRNIWCRRRTWGFLNVTFSIFWGCWGFLNGTALMICD